MPYLNDEDQTKLEDLIKQGQQKNRASIYDLIAQEQQKQQAGLDDQTVQLPQFKSEEAPVSEESSTSSELARLKDIKDKATGKTPVKSATTLPQAIDIIKDQKKEKKPSVAEALSALLGGSDKELSDAQEERDRRQMSANIVRSGQILGGAFTPLAKNRGADEEFYQQQMKQAQQPVEDVQNKQKLIQEKIKTRSIQEQLKNELAKEDPTSDISKIGRQLAQAAAQNAKLNIPIPDNISMSNLEKIMPGIETMANRRIQTDAASLQKQEKLGTQRDQEITKLASKMGEDLDPNKFRSGEMGKNQGKVNAAGRIEALLQQFPDGNIPKIQTRELATSVAAMLTNGSQTAVNQINELVPHTARGSATSIAEWVTGSPQGQGQQAFIKMFEDTTKREKEVAQQQIIQAQFKKAYGTHNKLKQKSPDDFYNSLATQTGLDPDTIKEMEKQQGFKGQYVAPKKQAEAPKLTSEDQQAVEWAKSNKDDLRAQQILKMHGM